MPSLPHPPLPHPPLLDQMLHDVARRYRVPAFPAASNQANTASPSTTLALAIEQARAALVRGDVPDATLQRRFVDALARVIHDAMRAEGGDAAFQAMVLRHRAPQVREYASLSARAEQDRRLIHATVNAIAHPAKQLRSSPGQQREALAQLHASASSASWLELADTARRLLAIPAFATEPLLERGLRRLVDGPELQHLQRLAALASDELVRKYRHLWDRHGPRSGSPAAAALGCAAQQRGAAVEESAAQALDALAQRLNAAQEHRSAYRVVTSMRVPSSIPADPDRAKSEWDVVLLRQAEAVDGLPAWDVCLLVEVKASIDAATTDFPRLLRGLRLLAHAKPDVVYAFATRQGEVRLRGASLAALSADEADLSKEVLYCCDAPAEESPRLLGAPSRMQLLSAQASLTFASRLVENQPTEAGDLEPIWQELLTSPRWSGVLNQFQMLRSVRELMVHVTDLRTLSR